MLHGVPKYNFGTSRPLKLREVRGKAYTNLIGRYRDVLSIMEYRNNAVDFDNQYESIKCTCLYSHKCTTIFFT
jgi:hypothetical protein